MWPGRFDVLINGHASCASRTMGLLFRLLVPPAHRLLTQVPLAGPSGEDQEKSWFIHHLMEAWDLHAVELADARRDADEAERTANFYLDELLKDCEVITALEEERYKLCQRKDEAHEWAQEILSSAERDRNIKLAVEDELAAMKARARQDTLTLTRVRKERDDLLQTAGRLCSEHKTARIERDAGRQQVTSLQAELSVGAGPEARGRGRHGRALR